MNILLLPPIDSEGSESPVTESPGLGYLAAYARHQGHTVECFEPRLAKLDYKGIAEYIGRSDAELVGFSILDNVEGVYQVSSILRRKRSSVHITTGGHLATFAHRLILKECSAIDSVVRFEGEKPLVQLARSLTSDQDLSSVSGLTYRLGAGITETAPTASFENLDDLPFPIRYLPNSHYQRQPFNLIASKGCYFRCTFCGVHRFYRASPSLVKRYHSPGYVVDQIEKLIDCYGNNRFWFMDDDLLGTSKRERLWIDQLIGLLEDRDIEMIFSLMCRSDTINRYPDLLQRLHSVGLKRLFVGIENINDDVLLRINKGVRIKGHKYISSSRNLGIELVGGMILFDRTTTVTELRNNLAFISQFKSDIQFNFDLLKVFFATPLYEDLNSKGQLLGTWRAPIYKFENQTIATVFHVYKGFKNYFWKFLDLPLRNIIWRHIGLPNPPFPESCIREALGMYNTLVVEIIRLALESSEALGNKGNPHVIFDNIRKAEQNRIEETLFVIQLMQMPSLWSGIESTPKRYPPAAFAGITYDCSGQPAC